MGEKEIDNQEEQCKFFTFLSSKKFERTDSDKNSQYLPVSTSFPRVPSAVSRASGI